MKMTDYYNRFKEHYTIDPRTAITHIMPVLEGRALAEFLKGKFPESFYKYNHSQELDEQNWAEIKQVFDLWDSPLMRALR